MMFSKQFRDAFIIGVALFAMFFGAGNLIFPPYMGLLGGESWALTFLGFAFTGIGLPLLGILAASRAGGSVEHLASRVSSVFGIILSVIVLLAIGPLLAIPRTAATAFELGAAAIWPEFSAVLFSVLFFGMTFWFTMNRNNVIRKIGKYLTPFLVLTLAWIIVRGIFFPIGEPGSASLRSPFGDGFREGYQTMDALASLVFTQIVIAALVYQGYKSTAEQTRLTLIAGSIAALGLLLVYGGLMYLGATAAGLFESNVERTTLLIGITEALLGGSGAIALGIAVTIACLTTAIGLTATVAEYFSRLTAQRLSYRTVAVITVVFSGFFAIRGVTEIVNIAYPLLVLVYPVAIVLILLTITGGTFIHRFVYVGGVSGALLVSIPEALHIAGIASGPFTIVLALIPFAEAGFAWAVAGLAGMLIGLLTVRVYYGTFFANVDWD
ncbi:branched-chain amino acid:cation transporter, LIVCS family [Cyclonatronum proteinivorum]|uniref:Branched-chain amino acid:cation transporter, LIVCS family n=1 Tax=Cyclonatronum proteinivorum TaxID=1457365 RepID=A0A345UKZ1_9BACT|nr:branched-chain amino acid transport system II carrier protein [Cyclonatronum proteinivorum]AXJ01143.1 branched-chain amino acid:cation transporter, LIVCS family [Cyclonatronum proteinivorum]